MLLVVVNVSYNSISALLFCYFSCFPVFSRLLLVTFFFLGSGMLLFSKGSPYSLAYLFANQTVIEISDIVSHFNDIELVDD